MDRSRSRRPVAIRAVVGLLALAGSPAAGREITLEFVNPSGNPYKMTFDPERIPESEVRALVYISPYFEADEFSVPLWLEVCIRGDPHYFECGSCDLGDPNFFKNARVNLDIDRERLNFLDVVKHPKELDPVIDYEKRALSFALWLQQTRYDFLQSWKTEVLARKYQGFDPSSACADQIARIEQATSPQAKYQLATYGWDNCAINFWAPFRKYPLDAWKRFLKRYGIKEEYIEIPPPD